MGEYEILIFITANQIQAIEVSSYGDVKNICFQGNKELNYNGIEGIDVFYASLTDTYNVDDIAELDTNVYIVDCGAEKEVKWAIVDKFKQCNVLDVISINKLLPFVLIRNNMVKAGEKAVVSFMGEVYAYICDNDMKFEELSTRGKKPQKELQAEDFAFWVMMDANGCGTDSGNNDELIRLQVELSEYKDRVESLSDIKLQNDTLMQKCEQLENIIEEYKNKIAGYAQQEKYNEEVDKKVNDELLAKRRQIVSTERQYCSFGSGPSQEFFVHYHAESGEITDKGDIIAEMKASRNADNGNEVEAPRTGKIACLYKQDERIDEYSKTHNNRCESSRSVPLRGMMVFKGTYYCYDIAVIGDEEDDVDAMIEWYWQRVKEINEGEGDTHYPNI